MLTPGCVGSPSWAPNPIPWADHRDSPQVHRKGHVDGWDQWGPHGTLQPWGSVQWQYQGRLRAEEKGVGRKRSQRWGRGTRRAAEAKEGREFEAEARMVSGAGVGGPGTGDANIEVPEEMVPEVQVRSSLCRQPFLQVPLKRGDSVDAGEDFGVRAQGVLTQNVVGAQALGRSPVLPARPWASPLTGVPQPLICKAGVMVTLPASWGSHED